jgi:hypothetical protein
VLETRLRQTELALFEGRHGDAFASATKLLAAAGTDDSTLMLRAALHRVRAYASVAAPGSETRSISDELQQSLNAAEAANSAYETALTCEAVARLMPDHDEADSWSDRQVEAFRRLGVVATPVILSSPATVTSG